MAGCQESIRSIQNWKTPRLLNLIILIIEVLASEIDLIDFWSILLWFSKVKSI